MIEIAYRSFLPGLTDDGVQQGSHFVEFAFLAGQFGLVHLLRQNRLGGLLKHYHYAA